MRYPAAERIDRPHTQKAEEVTEGEVIETPRLARRKLIEDGGVHVLQFVRGPRALIRHHPPAELDARYRRTGLAGAIAGLPMRGIALHFVVTLEQHYVLVGREFARHGGDVQFGKQRTERRQSCFRSDKSEIGVGFCEMGPDTFDFLSKYLDRSGWLPRENGADFHFARLHCLSHYGRRSMGCNRSQASLPTGRGCPRWCRRLAVGRYSGRLSYGHGPLMIQPEPARNSAAYPGRHRSWRASYLISCRQAPPAGASLPSG